MWERIFMVGCICKGVVKINVIKLISQNFWVNKFDEASRRFCEWSII